MAKIGKRVARRQITKDKASENSDDDHKHTNSDSDEDNLEKEEFKEIPVSQRQISRPVSISARFKRSGEEEPTVNPFKGLANLLKNSKPVEISNSQTTQSPSKLPQPLSTSHRQSHTQTQSQQSQAPDVKEREALANICALNEAFQKSISKAINLDKYIDFTGLFEQYKKHRRSLEEDYEYARRNRMQPVTLEFKPTVSLPPQTVVSQPPLRSEPTVKPFSFSSDNMSISQPQAQSLPATQPFLVQSEEIPDNFKPILKPLDFSTSKPKVIEQPKPAAFSFPSLPSLPAFGTNGQADKPMFSFGQTEVNLAERTGDKPSGPPLGQEQKFPESALPQPSVEQKEPKFSFGQPDKPFSFGQTAASFSFGQPTSQPPKVDNAKESEDEIPEGEEESFSSQRTNQDLIKRGEGEEQEQEIFAPLRTKLFLFDPAASAWTDLGIGLLKVNKNKEGKFRVLCRAEGSGRILLNAYLEKEVCECSWGVNGNTEGRKREVSLQVFNQDRKMAKYLIRTKEEDQSRILYGCLQEIL